MKKKLLASLFTTVLFVMVYHTNVYTNRANPPDGRTGGPGEGSCASAGCHGDGNSANPNNGEIILRGGELTPDTEIDDNFTYTPGTTYQVSVSIDPLAVAGTRFGFQLICLDQNDLMAGNYNINGANMDRTGLDNSNGRIYVEHRDADNGASWVFEWIAPATDVGPVTFYVAVNAANANGNASGDVIYQFSQTINSDPVGIFDPADANPNSLNVFPNPIYGDNINVSYEVTGNANVELSLYSIDGQLVEQLVNEQRATGSYQESHRLSNNVTSGVYMLVLREGTKTSIKKLMVH